MSRFEGPQGIVTNGLVLNLDAGDPDSYTRSQPPFVEVLVVAGGGGGGYLHGGGGGGAGGLIYNSAYQLTNAAAITVTVGAGGSGGNQLPTNGNNSVFGSLTAVGGGYGGSEAGPTPGANGGSGGGGSGYSTAQPGGTGTAGQGFNGGRGAYPDIDGTYGSGGGGGGAGAPGTDGKEGQNVSGSAGNGGNGQAYSISGTSTYYAGGGGGGYWGDNLSYYGVGGLGGGGNGGAGTSTNLSPTAGAVNTGGGGGGSRGDASQARPGAAGGSGIVIVRYPGLPAATGGTITYLNGYTIHTFTSSGTFTPYLWNDLSGNNNSGTLTNGVGFNSYQNGGGLIFDGVDDSVISPPPVVGSTGITIIIWFKSLSINSEQVLYDCNYTTNGCILEIYLGKPTFQINTTYTQSTSTLLSNQIYCVAVSKPNSGAGSFYVNAVNDGSTITSNLNIPNSNIRLGATTSTLYPFNGSIYAAQVYNRVLSAAEITQNYNAQKARFGL